MRTRLDTLGAAAALAWWSGIVVVTLIAAAATLFLAARLAGLWQDFPGEIGVAGIVGAAGVAAVAGAAALALLRVERLRRWMPWTGIGLVLLVRLPVVLLLDTRLAPDTDPAILSDLALGLLSGADQFFDHRPMGYSTLIAGLYATFGADPQLAELLNLAFALITAAALWLLIDRGFGRRPADVGLVAYALFPSAVFFTPLIYTETVYAGPLVAALAAAAVAAGARSRAGLIGFSLISGGLLGLSQYIRPSSQALVAAWVVVPFLLRLGWRRAATIALLSVAMFVAVLIPVAAFNLATHDELSVSTSAYGGWGVYLGTNQEHDGRFNRDDQPVLDTPPGTSIWERSEEAGRLGVQRILDDPLGFADLAVRKFWVLWADDTFGASFALSLPAVDGRTRAIFELLSQAAYAPLAICAAIGLYRGRRERPPAAFLSLGVIVIVALAHVVIEVQPRYHAYVVPLLIVLAAPVLADRLERLSTPSDPIR